MKYNSIHGFIAVAAVAATLSTDAFAACQCRGGEMQPILQQRHGNPADLSADSLRDRAAIDCTDRDADGPSDRGNHLRPTAGAESVHSPV
jgi:hypothetical protein